MAIPLPKAPRVIEQKNNRAFIEVSGLYPGYGYTLGNTLRRALYSSLPGAAITSVKIDGVSHEFSTKSGILEDLLEVSLNLKDVRLILHGEEPQMITLKVKGKRVVTAGDIETPSQVEIINKDMHIATLTATASSLNMEMRVERGFGYVQAGKDEKENKEIGVIQLDAVFTPVTLVNFEVENMRIGDRTDYNRLVFEIVTDGTISPEDAFEEASLVLVDHLTLMSHLEGKKIAKKKSVKKAKKAAPKKAPAKKKALAKKKAPAKKTTKK